MNIKKKQVYTFLKMSAGAAICAIGINLFIVPVNLYNGGAIGIAQIIRSLIHMDVPFDLSGILNFILNIPLFLLAYYKIGKKFFFKTLWCVIVETIFFSLVVLKAPIIEDRLTACLVGGIVSGYGVGLTLRNGACCGGLDILALYYALNVKNGTVGKLSAAVNGAIYAMCAILFDIQTAIYSLIYAVIFSFVIDKVHLQNINVSVIIFTKIDHVEDGIMKDLGRGVTKWKGAGAYTEQSTNILYTVINKYEINILKHDVLEKDPNAFIIFNDGSYVTGNLLKHFAN